MAINTNPTGIFPVAQLGADSPYTFLLDGEAITSTGGGVYIPLTDLEDYIPSASVLDEGHGDADYRYLLLAISEAATAHFGGLSSANKPKNVNLTEGDVKTSPGGKLHKTFTNKFWYDATSLRLDSASE